MSTQPQPFDSRAPHWLNRILNQYLAAASLRTIAGVRNRSAQRALRAYFARL